MMDVVWTLCMRLDRNLELLNNINRKYDMIGRSDASTSSVAMRVENEDELLLIAADEQLSSLEDVVRVMPTAQYLNVAFNCISCLSELEKMTELRSLDVSHNAVESLQEVATLSKLLVLKCSSNQIADLSWIAGLNYLEELWIRDNRIESAQLAYLQQLTALQTLVIHPNPCTEQDDYVELIPSSSRRSCEKKRDMQKKEELWIQEQLIAHYLRMSEDSYEDRVASLPAPPAAPPSKPAKSKKRVRWL
ncbi:hypothetical protein JG688_00001050 [Phytophthora aleatoria]|uniref:Uncharacterized protein n=1 Tax=Phytophthora aleatoria TaxID=2496075 RepID=A0A8J5MJ12_9STRA|nr:hypothetical protein JG688_00001050 [Phytophthora aleatoria]